MTAAVLRCVKATHGRYSTIYTQHIGPLIHDRSRITIRVSAPGTCCTCMTSSSLASRDYLERNVPVAIAHLGRATSLQAPLHRKPDRQIKPTVPRGAACTCRVGLRRLWIVVAVSCFEQLRLANREGSRIRISGFRVRIIISDG